MTDKQTKLVEDNMDLVYFLIHRYYPNLSNDDDLKQVGMIGLINAAMTWDESRAKFSSYASRCILNAINNEFYYRKKHYNILSLDKEIQSDDGNAPFSELVGGVDENEDCLEKADWEYFCNNKLTPKQKKIVSYMVEGLTAIEIADLLGYTPANVRLHRRTILAKWKKYNGYSD